jgi:hypothetical protein
LIEHVNEAHSLFEPGRKFTPHCKSTKQKEAEQHTASGARKKLKNQNLEKYIKKKKKKKKINRH